MSQLHRWALASTIATYFLIFVGGLVRVSGAGLGCPDWPKCFGRWIPPTSLAQLPANVDPGTFSVTLAWIEYINRLIGVVIGLLILVTAIVAIRFARRMPRLIYPALAALVLVALEGWQGGTVVGSKLAPFVVTIHMVLAFILASVLIYLTLQTHWTINPNARGDAGGSEHARWMWPLWLIAIISVALGTQVRSEIETLMARFPSEDAGVLMTSVGWVKLVHPLVGGILLVASWWIGLRLIWRRGPGEYLVRTSAWALMSLSAFQLILGLVLVGIGLPAIARVTHLWLSSLYVGALVVLHVNLRSRTGDLHA